MELVKYNYNGVMMTQKEICEKTGISPSTMCNRLHAGMSVDEAVAKGIVKKKITRRPKREIKYMVTQDKIYETDSSGQKRKKWGFLSENEIYNLRKKCKTCKHVSMKGRFVDGCSYFDDVGRCRRCDPRDCEQFGFYEYQETGTRRRGMKPISL